MRCKRGKIKTFDRAKRLQFAPLSANVRAIATKVFEDFMERCARLISLIACAAVLASCGIFGSNDQNPLEIQSVGPSIKEVLKPLPKDLVGDKDNKLYGFDELRPPPEETSAGL